jgi:hypothetical protein
MPTINDESNKDEIHQNREIFSLKRQSFKRIKNGMKSEQQSANECHSSDNLTCK